MPKLARALGSRSQPVEQAPFCDRSHASPAPMLGGWLPRHDSSSVSLPRFNARSTLPVAAELCGLGALRVSMPCPALIVTALALVLQALLAMPR